MRLWPRRSMVGSTVVLLGLTSLFTDISSEMVNSILPLYLTSRLGFSPLHFGLFDGLYHGITAFVRIGGGLLADRHQRYKEVAGVGYALSAVCKIGLWLAGSAWAIILAVLLLDRTGKGIRTAPRDALISLSTPSSKLGEAFGVHRALDTTGAFLGPMVAFMLLAAIPAAYDVVFITSFFFAMIGLGILFFFVANIAPTPDMAPEKNPRLPLRDLFILLSDSRFKAVLLAGAVLSSATVSDNFIYLTLQRSASLPPSYFPLLYVATALVYLLFAVPAGRLSDRIGRPVVFLAGHGLLLTLYGVLLWLRLGPLETALSLLLLGAYYAATDGVLMGMASAVLPPERRTTGLALLTTATALTRLVGSVLYGALWTWHGAEWALAIFFVGLIAAGAFGGAILMRPNTRTVQ